MGVVISAMKTRVVPEVPPLKIECDPEKSNVLKISAKWTGSIHQRKKKNYRASPKMVAPTLPRNPTRVPRRATTRIRLTDGHGFTTLDVPRAGAAANGTGSVDESDLTTEDQANLLSRHSQPS